MVSEFSRFTPVISRAGKAKATVFPARVQLPGSGISG